MDAKQLIIAALNEDLRTFKNGVEAILEQRIDEAIEKLKKETIAEMGLKCRKEQELVDDEDELCEDENERCDEQCQKTIKEQIEDDREVEDDDLESDQEDQDDGDEVEGDEVTVYADDDVEVECKCTKKTKKAENADGEEAKSDEAEIRDELTKSDEEDEK